MIKMLMNDFYTHCKLKYPEEACGVICNKKFIPIENSSDNKSLEFFIDYETIETIETENNSKITAILHSHSNGSIVPSLNDMKAQISLDIPFGLCNIRYNEYTEEFDISRIFWLGVTYTQLENRPYIFGIFDCYSLLRDTLKLKYSIEIPNVPRYYGWEKTENLFLDNFEKLGFTEISINEVDDGDVFLATFPGFKNKPIHCGVYIGNDKIIHHLSGNKPTNFSVLSRVEHVNRIIPSVTHWLRYVEK